MLNSDMTYRDRLIALEVKSLQDFGYPACSAETLMVDELYRAFFISHLREARAVAKAPQREVIDGLLQELEPLPQPLLGKRGAK